MLKLTLSLIQKHSWRFIKAAVLITGLLLGFRLIGHYFGIKHLLQSISVEAWLGAGLTILTTVGGAIIERQKNRSQQLQNQQDLNRQLIESSHAEIVTFVRRLEDTIDDFNVRLLGIKALQEADRELHEADKELIDRLHTVEILLTEIQEKQRASDYLFPLLGTIKQLCEDVALIKEKLP